MPRSARGPKRKSGEGSSDRSLVWIVHHVRRLGGGDEDVKLIGVYSSRNAARAAAKRLRRRPGFAQFPRGFEISQYALDEDQWTRGFVTVLD